jgi:hypothetical protein
MLDAFDQQDHVAVGDFRGRRRHREPRHTAAADAGGTRSPLRRLEPFAVRRPVTAGGRVSGGRVPQSFTGTKADGSPPIVLSFPPWPSACPVLIGHGQRWCRMPVTSRSRRRRLGLQSRVSVEQFAVSAVSRLTQIAGGRAYNTTVEQTAGSRSLARPQVNAGVMRT